MLIKKRNLFVLITLLLQLTLACSAQTTQGEKWVIFSESQTRELGIANWFASDGQTVDYWTPTEEDVTAIESKLVSFLQNNADEFWSPVWESLDEYNRQYMGIILGEQRIVYANFFVIVLNPIGEKNLSLC